MNEVEKTFKEKSTVSRKFTIPQIFWEEWESDCIAHFNNTYHLKMQFDHQFRQEFAAVSQLLIQDIVELREQVFELSAKIAELESKPAESKKSGTFGAK